MKRSKSLALLFAFVGGAVALISAPQTWVTVSFGSASSLTFELAGQVASPALVAISSAVLASAAVLALVRGVARHIFAAIGAALAIALAIVVLAARAASSQSLADAALRASGIGAGGIDTSELLADWTALVWVAFGAAVLAFVGFVFAVLTASRWPLSGQRYERTQRATDTAAGQWDALSDGDDPTAVS